MASIPFEEFTRLVWVPGFDGIADPEAPTTGELNDAAVEDLSTVIPKDGWDPGITTSAVDDSDLGGIDDKAIPGTRVTAPTLRGKRKSVAEDDILWALADRGVEGYFVERRAVPFDTDWTAAQEVTVIKAILGDPQPAATASNALQSFVVPVFPQGTVVKAVVAAGS